ncbi:hypothetical protein BH09PAT1_BH09PAT1_6110 [soil metagenome]
MRKILLVALPIAIVSVISLSFYVLFSSHKSQFPVAQVSAASTKRKFSRKIFTPSPTPTKIAKYIKIATPTPTVKPTVTPTPTKKLTAIPTQTKVITPTATPIPPVLGTSLPGDPIRDFIMQKINDYRVSQGLQSVKTDSYTCDFAKIRAQEISSNFNHDGFNNRINGHTLPYPSYHEVTENIAMTNNYQEVVTMWINSPGHAENMRQDTPNVCVEKSGANYAYEGWRP